MTEKRERHEEEEKERSGNGRARGETEEEETRDDRETPPDLEDPETPAAVTFFGYVQDGIYYVIAAVLVGLAIAASVRIGIDFFTLDEPFAKQVTRGVNGILFVVIVLELLRTILAHFEDDTFQLKPFLIIGIISSVRHILTVGAELSIAEEDTSHLWHRADVELGVNALVVLVLVLGLVFVRKTE
ncbi:MAG: phosphate-starvation-inducible PsiE family protein [Acidimicrobiales bacterium]